MWGSPDALSIQPEYITDISACLSALEYNTCCGTAPTSDQCPEFGNNWSGFRKEPRWMFRWSFGFRML